MGRISLTVDAVDADAIDNANKSTSPKRKHLAIIRIMTTAKKLRRLLDSVHLPAEGDWVSFSVTLARTNQTPVWAYSAIDDYFEGSRGSLSRLEFLDQARPPASLSSAISPVAMAYSRLMDRYDLRRMQLSQRTRVQKYLASISVIQTAVVHDVGQASLCCLNCSQKGIDRQIFIDAGMPLPCHRSSLPKHTTFKVGSAATLIITHWDWDHVSCARYRPDGSSSFGSALWIAPRQVVGPNVFEFFVKPHFASGKLWLVNCKAKPISSSCLTLIQGAGKDRNNSGLGVVAKTNDGARFLFPGDAEFGSSGLTVRGKFSGLAMPHHGAKTGGTIPNPRNKGISVVAVSVGRPNVYGHPAQAEINQYAAKGWIAQQTSRLRPGRGRPRLPNDILLR